MNKPEITQWVSVEQAYSEARITFVIGIGAGFVLGMLAAIVVYSP